MVDKFLMVDMDDERTEKIAEILSNKTAKKILSLIAEKELSETDIANELRMPLNTIDYNIKNLLEVGLIEKSKNFFWSVKGKKIETYKLANKKIIISTKPSFKGILSTMIIFGALGFIGNVFSNIFSVSKQVFGGNLLSQNFAADMVEKSIVSGVSTTGLAAPSASNISPDLFSFSSMFHNVWIWVLAGFLAGALIFLLYKKLKGGKF